MDERITLVKKWVSKWAQQDFTKIEPKVEYFNKERNTKEIINGEKEFSLNRVKTLDTLTMSFQSAPVTGVGGEFPKLKIHNFIKKYPDFTVDKLELAITPSSDSKTKGTVIARQLYADLNGEADVWRITFIVPM